eukprot:6210049-Pleurochrysis_carterae.AAC.1
MRQPSSSVRLLPICRPPPWLCVWRDATAPLRHAFARARLNFGGRHARGARRGCRAAARRALLAGRHLRRRCRHRLARAGARWPPPP